MSEERHEIVLYHGDNGLQEFYEDNAGHQWGVVRNHTFGDTTRSEPWRGWGTWEDRDASPFYAAHGDTAEHVMRQLSELTGIRLRVDPSREWRFPEPGSSYDAGALGDRFMQLVDIDTGVVIPDDADYAAYPEKYRPRAARVAQRDAFRFEAPW